MKRSIFVIAIVLAILLVPTNEASASLPYVDNRELMESSSLIVHGRVIARSEPFTVENVRGGMTGQFASFVDYSVEIYEVLRGDSSANEIVVRIDFFNQPYHQSNMMPVSSAQQALEIGGEYLLFLSLPGESVFDTLGHYYYLNRGFQGVFARESEMMFIQGAYGSRAIDLAALRDELIDINATVPPPTEEDNRQRMLDTLYNNMTGILIWNEDYWQEAITRPPRPGQIVPTEESQTPQPGQIVTTEESQDSFSPLLTGIGIGAIITTSIIIYLVKPFRKK